jgi:hypothetical protein
VNLDGTHFENGGMKFLFVCSSRRCNASAKVNGGLGVNIDCKGKAVVNIGVTESKY